MRVYKKAKYVKITDYEYRPIASSNIDSIGVAVLRSFERQLLTPDAHHHEAPKTHKKADFRRGPVHGAGRKARSAIAIQTFSHARARETRTPRRRDLTDPLQAR